MIKSELHGDGPAKRPFAILGYALQFSAIPLPMLIGDGSMHDISTWIGLTAATVAMSAGSVLVRKADTPAIDTCGNAKHMAFEKSADAILICGESTIIDCNPAAVRFLKARSKADIVGLHPGELSPDVQPDGRRSVDVVNETNVRAVRDGFARVEFTHRCLDHSTAPFEVTLVPVVVGREKLLLVYWKDISSLVALRGEKDRSTRRLVEMLNGSVRNVAEALLAMATSMSGNAQDLALTADQTNRKLVGAVSASEQVAVNVGTVAATSKQLSAALEDISRQIAKHQTATATSVQDVDRANVTMAKLTQAATRIGDVVNLIQSIASQTNLLALNATIEAARAGDAGKGFSVVANEVKGLANQTAKATEDIQAQVSQMQDAAKAAVEAIERIAATIGRMNEATTIIAAAVHQQGMATQEIAGNVQQAFSGTKQVSIDINELTLHSAHTEGMAGRMQMDVDELKTQTTSLQQSVQDFVACIMGA